MFRLDTFERQLDAFHWLAANGWLVGWNGPIFQLSGKAEQLQFDPAEFEFSIKIGRVLIFGFELRVLLVAKIGITGPDLCPHGLQVSLSNFPFQFGNVSCCGQLSQRPLEL